MHTHTHTHTLAWSKVIFLCCTAVRNHHLKPTFFSSPTDCFVFFLFVCLFFGGDGERERELVVCHKVWEFFLNLIFTHFVSCNGPSAPEEKWHRKEHNYWYYYYKQRITIHLNHSAAYMHVLLLCTISTGRKTFWKGQVHAYFCFKCVNTSHVASMVAEYASTLLVSQKCKRKKELILIGWWTCSFFPFCMLYITSLCWGGGGYS